SFPTRRSSDLFFGMISVCAETIGIGTRLNNATTANQSASAPTIAASDIARNKPTHQASAGRNRVDRNINAANSKKERARRLDFFNSSSLVIEGELLRIYALIIRGE